MRSEIQALATETKNISGTTQQIYDDLQEMSKDSKQTTKMLEGLQEMSKDSKQTTKTLEGKLDDLTKTVERLGKGRISKHIQGESKRMGPSRKKILKIDVNIIFEK